MKSTCLMIRVEPRRPVIVVENGESALTDEHIEKLSKGSLNGMI